MKIWFDTAKTARRPVPTVAPPDDAPLYGMVGPDSMAWRINGEIITILGWGPAVLLQLAQPLVAAGVAQHSLFRDPAHKNARFHNTLKAMLDMTFGSPTQATQATRRINSVHKRIRGNLGEGVGTTPGGTAYSALDPNLLIWVQVTTAAMMMEAYARFVKPLTLAERDRYIAEVAASGPSLGIPDGRMPTTQAELDAYFARMYASGEISVGDEARELFDALLAPLPIPVLGGVLRWLSEVAVAGMLPETIRVGYGLKWDRKRALILETSAIISKVLVRILPRRLHRWPVAIAAERRTNAHTE